MNVLLCFFCANDAKFNLKTHACFTAGSAVIFAEVLTWKERKIFINKVLNKASVKMIVLGILAFSSQCDIFIMSVLKK